MLQENFPAFYSDISDIAEALDSFVLADILEEMRFKTPSSVEKHSLLDEIAAEIVGRAVLDSNMHPAPSKHFSVKRPQHLQLPKAQREARVRLEMFGRPSLEWLDVVAFTHPEAFGGEFTLESLALN